MPAWPKRRGGAQVWPVFLFVKSSPASGGAAFTAAGKAAQLAAKGRFFILERQGARRKTVGVMTPARREKAVLAYPRANLKGHFVRNGCNRAFSGKAAAQVCVVIRSQPGPPKADLAGSLFSRAAAGRELPLSANGGQGSAAAARGGK